MNELVSLILPIGLVISLVCAGLLLTAVIAARRSGVVWASPSNPQTLSVVEKTLPSSVASAPPLREVKPLPVQAAPMPAPRETEPPKVRLTNKERVFVAINKASDGGVTFGDLKTSLNMNPSIVARHLTALRSEGRIRKREKHYVSVPSRG